MDEQTTSYYEIKYCNQLFNRTTYYKCKMPKYHNVKNVNNDNSGCMRFIYFDESTKIKYRSLNGNRMAMKLSKHTTS